MQIVIDIPKEAYEIIKKDTESEMYIIQVIKQGIPLPENHGRLIDADAEIEAIKKYACKHCESYDGIKCRACWADDLIGHTIQCKTCGTRFSCVADTYHGQFVFDINNA